METSQWDIYVKFAAIVAVPISIIGIYITYRSGKSPINNSETRINEIADSINQRGQINVGGNENFRNAKFFNCKINITLIQKDYEDSSDGVNS